MGAIIPNTEAIPARVTHSLERFLGEAGTQ